jgi:hypothetical protein
MASSILLSAFDWVRFRWLAGAHALGAHVLVVQLLAACGMPAMPPAPSDVAPVALPSSAAGAALDAGDAAVEEAAPPPVASETLPWPALGARRR